ncbi:unnamed protein product [Spirodela intermedia]|uniref:Protein kinase domain-containing protein n=1 Tax=Spirodela intermedia TaxID=51605 RepID=A0A7I8LA14_SPIIN|nr:unnamed protein product [Spirodela intermedia]
MEQARFWFKLIKQVGDGSFGSVWRAVNKLTGEIVAIKKMKKKYYSWQECINLREVKSLRKMNHPGIVKLKEVIREHDILYLVFEYMDFNLYQLMKDREKPFSETDVRNWSFQIFHALAHMHQRGYFHRDLKPENLLITKDIIKVADFGLAREICSDPPFTEYVSTRWYRAPEVLLQSTAYDFAVDMWAMGAIMAELLTLSPLFPGASEADEIHKICSVIGCPSHDSWGKGFELASAIKYQFPQLPGVPLPSLIPSASEDAISLISLLCSWDPCKRPTATAALEHPFFQPCHRIPALGTGTTGIHKTPPSVGRKGASESKASRRYSTGALLSSKPVGSTSLTKPTASVRTGAQRKLEMDAKSAEKNKDSVKAAPKLLHYRPTARNRPGPVYAGRPLHKASDVTRKLAQITLSQPGKRLGPGTDGPTQPPWAL